MHTSFSSRPSSTFSAVCPFHNGAETLDLLLGEIAAHETDLLDAALDLRTLLNAGTDAAACLAQLFRVRALLGGRHYLAFYRLRRWITRRIVAQVRRDRASSWTTCEIPPAGARLDEVTNLCLAPLAIDGVIPLTACVRFLFAPVETPQRAELVADFAETAR